MGGGGTRWRQVAVAVLVLAGVVFIPPLIGRTGSSSPSTSAPRVEMNPADGHQEFQKFFPGQPWAIELVELQSLWGWTQGGPYGWVNEDRRTPEVEVVDGRRTTLEVEDPQVTVWLFGGSTVFGFGQRTDHTIASTMVREAQERGIRLRVENYGVSGYVNWQETQVFADELAAGRRPDLAVFLDGANDTALGVERERYGLFDTDVIHRQTMTDDQRKELESAAAARGYESKGDLDAVVRLAVDQYDKGVRWARELGEQHDVPVFHFWQPQLYTMPLDAPLVRDALERWEISEDSHREMGKVVRRIAEESEADPVDLTGILDDVRGPIFYDTTHTNETGARIEGEAILDELWPQLARLAREAVDPRSNG